MKLKAKCIGIESGFTPVVTINRNDAIRYDLHPLDRVLIETVGRNKRHVIAVVNVEDRESALRAGHVGLFVETERELQARDGSVVDIHPAPKPESLKLIKKKMSGKRLTEREYNCLVKDIVDGELTEVELTYFVAAVSMQDLNLEETTGLTKAIANYGSKFVAGSKIVVDKHCIGGIPGNRTTMVVIPILSAFGLIMPKTSSRAITSPAGTADTMEALCKVSLSLDEMQRVVRKTGACIAWGGSLGLAPADDKIIRIEKPMSIDATGLMLASVMAKKYCVGATHVIIDIPFGRTAKVETRFEAEELKQHFMTLGTLLGMKLTVVITDGRQPIGRGIGPVLEARDVMSVLRCEKNAPQDLREKSLRLAAEMLEFSGSVKRGAGYEVARDILDSGSALKKMEAIIAAQGPAAPLRLGSHSGIIRATKSGIVRLCDNKGLSKLARMAGAPITRGAGIYMHKKLGDKVKKGDALYTVYADSAEKLRHVKKYHEELKPYHIN